MRALFPSNAELVLAEKSRGLGLVGALAIFAAFVALRIYCAFTLSMNSDEPQHLHVTWAWTQGLASYRHVFGNHAPLFQLICAPLLAWLGERPDVVALMRLAMIPLCLGALSLTGLGGARGLAGACLAFVPSADGRLAVVWAPALRRGLQRGDLFPAIDR